MKPDVSSVVHMSQCWLWIGYESWFQEHDRTIWDGAPSLPFTGQVAWLMQSVNRSEQVAVVAKVTNDQWDGERECLGRMPLCLDFVVPFRGRGRERKVRPILPRVHREQKGQDCACWPLAGRKSRRGPALAAGGYLSPYRFFVRVICAFCRRMAHG